jgi:hypothetical protein
MADPATMLRRWLALLTLTYWPLLTHAQANYEIQVYGADTVPPQNLMVELHSNFTAEGSSSPTSTSHPSGKSTSASASALRPAPITSFSRPSSAGASISATIPRSIEGVAATS